MSNLADAKEVRALDREQVRRVPARRDCSDMITSKGALDPCLVGSDSRRARRSSPPRCVPAASHSAALGIRNDGPFVEIFLERSR